MSRLLSPALLAVLIAVAGCAPAALGPYAVPELNEAAEALDDQLAPAGQLAATAALLAEEGVTPTSPFELLGSPAAAETGARNINFSALDLRQEAEGLRLTYTLLPTRADPTDRMGSLLIRPSAGRADYEAQVLLTRTEDPDHTGRRLDLVRVDNYAVRQLSGRFGIDLGTVRQRAGEADEQVLPERPYTVTFTPSPGLQLTGRARALAGGYTVTVSD